MTSQSPNDPRRACIQQLESDLFLGAKALPLDRANIPRFFEPLAPDDESAIPPSTMTHQEKRQALDALEQQVKVCQKCPLSQTRTNTVFSRGNPAAELVFVGEAPGYYEDQQGLAFVGRAGKLLDDIVTKGMGLARDDVYICNVLKCRPPQNRDPGSTEVVCCLPYLERQLEIISPKVICCLGRIAAQCLLETRAPMKELRGRWHTYRGIKTMVTYHTAYLLRNPADKKKSWLDIQQVMAELGLKRPKAS